MKPSPNAVNNYEADAKRGKDISPSPNATKKQGTKAKREKHEIIPKRGKTRNHRQTRLKNMKPRQNAGKNEPMAKRS